MNIRLLEQIKEERANLEKYARAAKKRLAKAPEGTLRTSTCRGTTTFYQRADNGNTTGTYLGRDKRDLIEALAQKAYDQDLLERINAEAAQLDALIAANEPVASLDAAYQQLSETRKPLVLPYEQDNETLRCTWPLTAYPRLNPPEKDKAVHTARGEAVRSKSEVIIANTLAELGIPYRYEQELQLNRTTTVHPDFTVLRLSDRKTIIWEHFGMMDDPDYCAKALRKIQSYQRAGYTQGVNLIMTIESAAVPLDARAVKRLAQELLV